MRLAWSEGELREFVPERFNFRPEFPCDFRWRAAQERCRLLANYDVDDLWAECDKRLDKATEGYSKPPVLSKLMLEHWRGRIERGTARPDA